ncbi:hypothetical protein [Alloalcanivorax profundimaris]|uniref:Uncharacterized protein n=1 Tax=Alloalcanivorax profundimaris TaxID=2735259 RepID=A0ABS0AU10_9GAMM|nr:hypothetical protein [Alloalcanivorax profundimaris]MBF1801945.1 hypothetical protein [Alloalcanivorax profundimaris]MBF5056961.1 hypothetical protein [Alloalcanivorax profundimaris]MBU60358.1 hypothetical protein [Alcanivorax sp.]
MFELPLHLSPMLPSTPALHEILALPLAVFTALALLLWSGRIRQKVLVNVLALGIMLPMVQLSMVAVGAYWLNLQLQPVLMGLLPSWLG